MTIAPKSLRAFTPTQLSILNYNVHLFGEAAEGTPLYLHDKERLARLPKCLMDTDADIIVLSEVWSQEAQNFLRETLKGTYQSISSPCVEGVPARLHKMSERYPRVAGFLEKRMCKSVYSLSNRHYMETSERGWLNGMKDYLSPMVRATNLLHTVLRRPLVLGAGLMVFSKYPMEGNFYDFKNRVGFDRFIGKGYIQAEITLPGDHKLNLLHTHLQEGESLVARKARKIQMGELAKKGRDLPNLLITGDLNYRFKTPEYEEMSNITPWLHDALMADLFTYFDPNPFKRGQGAPECDENGYRLDYVRYHPEAYELVEETTLDGVTGIPGLPMSDHTGLLVVLNYLGAMATAARQAA